MRTLASIPAPLLLLCGLLFLFTQPAQADGDVEVEGPIEALGESTVTVAGYTFLVIEATEIEGDDEEELTFDDLELDLFVEIEGFYAQDSTLVADEIEVETSDGDDDDDGDDGDEIEVEGLITELTESGLTVGGFFFFVTEATEIENDDEEIAFEDLQVGQFAEVEGYVNEAGERIAEEIEVENLETQEIEVEGAIEALGASTVTVGGYTFLVTDDTEIEADDEPIDFADLMVGMFAEVEGFYAADGTLVAEEIEIEEFDEDEIEVEGAIEALGDASLTVLGLTFEVNDATIIVGDDDAPLTFADLAVGLYVEVHADDVEGTLVATRIEVEDDLGDDGEVELKAALDSVGDDTIVILTRAFAVLPSTPILGLDDEPIALADLAAGDVVEVDARRDADGSLIALRIEREDDPATEIELEAAVTAVGVSTLDVLGISFLVNEATVIVNDDDEPIALADLMVGQRVEVDAVVEEGGVRRATRIEVEDDGQVAGRVGMPGAGTFDLASLRVNYDGTVLFVDESGAPFDPASLQSGQAVRVSGSPGAQATIDASRVIVLGAQNPVSAEGAAVPATFSLDAVYPNPFAGRATVRYTLDDASRVSLTVVDVLGREVQHVADATAEAGTHTVALDAAGLAGGLYFVVLDVEGSGRDVQRVVVAR